MDATAHLLAGAAAGVRLKPHWALGAGLLTHALIDAIPHANYTGWRPFSWLLVADILVGGIVVVIIAMRSGNAAGALAGAFGGILPAVERHLSGQYEDFLARPPLSLPDMEVAPPLGFVTQGVVIALALLLAFGTPVYRRSRGGTRLVKRWKM